MKTDWKALDAALERRPPTLWWRDDDAVEPTAALDRLIALAETVSAPLTLAVIPARATKALAQAIHGKTITAAIHGLHHANHAPTGEKKAEFGAHRPVEALLADATDGKARIEALFGASALPLFVPPWNRMADTLPRALANAGFSAVSAFAQRSPSEPAPGFIRIDTHIDPIDWRGTRSAVDMQILVDHVTALLATNAPIGLMTHHLVHDEAVWTLVEGLVKRLTRYGAKWVSASNLIGSATKKTPLTSRHG